MRVCGAGQLFGGITKTNKKESTLKDETNRKAATHSLESANVRSECQYVIDEGDGISLATLEMFWEQRSLQTLRGVKNKPGNRFKMRQPRDPWIDRQTDKRLF